VVKRPRATGLPASDTAKPKVSEVRPTSTTCTWMSMTSPKRTGDRNSHEEATRGQPINLPSSCRTAPGSTPSPRSSSCSAISMNTKKRAKWAMPPASVSENSIRRRVRCSCMVRAA
jgi:hypothetical protein